MCGAQVGLGIHLYKQGVFRVRASHRSVRFKAVRLQEGRGPLGERKCQASVVEGRILSLSVDRSNVQIQWSCTARVRRKSFNTTSPLCPSVRQ